MSRLSRHNVLEAEHAASRFFGAAASQGQLNAIKMVGAGGLDVNVQNLEKERMARSTRGPGEPPNQRNRKVGA